MTLLDKPLAWMSDVLKTPPLSDEARIEAGYLLRLLQRGENLSLPQSRPMPTIGKRCHELRITDAGKIWRIFYRIDEDAIVIPHWVQKTTSKTAKKDIELCKARLREYDSV